MKNQCPQCGVFFEGSGHICQPPKPAPNPQLENWRVSLKKIAPSGMVPNPFALEAFIESLLAAKEREFVEALQKISEDDEFIYTNLHELLQSYQTNQTNETL